MDGVPLQYLAQAILAGVALLGRHAAVAQERIVLGRHEEGVLGVAFSPDGAVLASGGAEVKFWDVATGKKHPGMTSHRSAMGGVAFSPDGKTMAALSADHVIVWDVVTGRECYTLKRGAYGFRDQAFSADGRFLVTSGFVSEPIKVWDAKTGRLQRSGPKCGPVRIALSPDGRTFATGGTEVKLWETVTGEPRLALAGRSRLGVWGLAFSPNGKWLASCDMDGTLRLWDIQSGTPLAVVRHEDSVFSVAFSPDGRTIATGSADGSVRLWETATRGLRATLKGHKNMVTALAFSPDGRRLASGDAHVFDGGPGEVILWTLPQSRSWAPSGGKAGW